jgi:hypothetical protein
MVDESGPGANVVDTESEASYQALADRIAWELGARIAVGDDPGTPEGLKRLSELVADSILDGFEIRPRVSPRYRVQE